MLKSAISILLLVLASGAALAAPMTASSPNDAARQPAATTQATTDTVLLHSTIGRLAAGWNRIPTDVKRTGPASKPTEVSQVSFYNPYTRKNEQAVVSRQRFQIQHAPVKHIEEMLRAVLTNGLGYVEADETHAEVTVIDRPAALSLASKAVAALDVPYPSYLYKIPFENSNTIQALIRSHLSPKGALTSLSSTLLVVSDSPDYLAMIDWLLHKSKLLYAPNALQARDAQWRKTPRTFGSFPKEKPLQAKAMWQGKVVTVEQRLYPVLYAAPSVVMEAAHRVATRGLGKVNYDLDNNMLMLMDLPEVLARFDTYMRLLDTEKPARLYVTSPKNMQPVKTLLQKIISAQGELIPFEKDGVIIVRDTELELERIDSLASLNFNSATSEKEKLQGPVSRPSKTLPLKRIFPASRPSLPASRPASGPASQP